MTFSSSSPGLDQFGVVLRRDFGAVVRHEPVARRQLQPGPPRVIVHVPKWATLRTLSVKTDNVLDQ